MAGMTVVRTSVGSTPRQITCHRLVYLDPQLSKCSVIHELLVVLYGDELVVDVVVLRAEPDLDPNLAAGMIKANAIMPKR